MRAGDKLVKYIIDEYENFALDGVSIKKVEQLCVRVIDEAFDKYIEENPTPSSPFEFNEWFDDLLIASHKDT